MSLKPTVKFHGIPNQYHLPSQFTLKFPRFNINLKSSISQEEDPTLIMPQSKLSASFRSIKPHSNPNPKIDLSTSKLPINSRCSSSRKALWCVYLIASTNPPIKTYVGVTTDFARRLKQHNGELKGGAKASRCGRPWVCACLVQGFASRSEACVFESKWKNISRKLPRRRRIEGVKEQEDKGLLLLLQHRHAAMEKLKHSFDFGHLEVDWQLSPS